jgi:hypothetical protein
MQRRTMSPTYRAVALCMLLLAFGRATAVLACDWMCAHSSAIQSAKQDDQHQDHGVIQRHARPHHDLGHHAMNAGREAVHRNSSAEFAVSTEDGATIDSSLLCTTSEPPAVLARVAFAVITRDVAITHHAAGSPSDRAAAANSFSHSPPRISLLPLRI